MPEELTWDDERIEACKCKVIHVDKNEKPGERATWQLVLDNSKCPVHGEAN